MKSAADLERLERAVQDAERGTAGEIVVVIAPRSASWAGARAAIAVPVALLAGVLASQALAMHAAWVPVIVAVALLVAWIVAGLGPVVRAAVGAGALDEAVLRAAKVSFLDHGVHATKTRAGVIVYVSQFEHRVQVLGDAGVHAVVGDEGWRAWAERVGGAMKAHDVDALVAVIGDVGAVLAKAFPRQHDDVNELPDAPRAAGA